MRAMWPMIPRRQVRGVSTTSIATTLPSDFDNLEVWLKADAGVESDGARLFALANQEYFTRPGDDTEFSVGSGVDFSMAFWVMFNTINIFQWLPNKWDQASQREYLCNVSTGNRFQWWASSDGTSGGQTSITHNTFGAVSTGTWYFVYVEYDDALTQLKMVINNSSTETASHSGGIFNGTSTFRIGQPTGGSAAYFDGAFDECIVLKRTMTSAEQTWLYNSGSGQKWANIGVAGTNGSNLKTSMVAYYGCDENSGNLIDLHTSGLDLTDTNTVDATAGAVEGTASDGSGVSKWIDQSPNAYEYIQATPANRPTFQTNEINGLPVVRGDGVDDQMVDTATSNITGVVTAFAVVKLSSTTDQTLIGRDDASTRWAVDLDDRDRLGASQLIHDFPRKTGEVTIVGCKRDASNNWLAYRDGQVADASISDADTFRLEALFSNAAQVEPLDGDLCELIVYSSDLPDADRVIIEQYLADKWGITHALDLVPSSFANLGYWLKADAGVLSDGARQFTGASQQYFTTPDSAHLSNDNQKFCAWGWIYPDTSGTDRRICMKGVDENFPGGYEWAVSRSPNGDMRFSIADGNDEEQVTNDLNTATAGSWHMWAANYNTETFEIELSVDDGQVITANATDGIRDWTDPFTVGKANLAANYWNGRQDELGWIKGYILTAADITWLYNGGSGRKFQDIIDRGGDLASNLLSSGIYLPFDEASGDAIDATGNIPNLTNTNTVTAIAGVAEGTATDGSVVSTWQDQSGNSRHFTQTSHPAKPTLQTNEINGLPVVRADAVDDGINRTSSDFDSDNAGTMIMVIQGTWGGNDRIWNYDRGVWRDHIALEPKDTSSSPVGAAAVIITDTGGTAHHVKAQDTVQTAPDTLIAVFGSDGTNSFIRIDGNEETLVLTGSDGIWRNDVSAGTMTERFFNLNTSSQAFYPGDIGEVMYYQRGLDNFEKFVLERYLSDRWGITLT